MTSPVCLLAYCSACASHTLTSPQREHAFSSKPPPPDTIRVPSGLKHALCTSQVCPLRSRVCCPVCASHTFTSPGLTGTPPPETIRLPSGENATLWTQCLCPWRVSCSCPVCASHTFSVLSFRRFRRSPLPDTMRLPSGLKATG